MKRKQNRQPRERTQDALRLRAQGRQVSPPLTGFLQKPVSPPLTDQAPGTRLPRAWVAPYDDN